MSTYSDDLDKIREIITPENGHLDYFLALRQMQDIAMELAAEKFRLSMTVAMMQGEPEPKVYRPAGTARNMEA